MQPTQTLADDLYCDRVLRARKLPAERKLLAGTQLFDDVVERMKAGIRTEFPNASEHQVNQTLIERVNRLRRVEEYGVYRSMEPKRCNTGLG